MSLMALCHSGTFLLACSKSVQQVLTVAMKIETQVQPVFGLNFHSCAMETSTTFAPEFYQRDVTDGTRSPWKLPVSRGVEVSKSFHEVVKVARKRVNTMQPLFGLGFGSSATKDV